jgi:hypothetical protein
VNTPSTAVSPGIGAFLAFFALAVALWLLMRNMNARMRRMSYRAEEAQQRAEAEARGAHEAPRGEADGPQEDDGDGSPRDDEPPAGRTG